MAFVCWVRLDADLNVEYFHRMFNWARIYFMCARDYFLYALISLFLGIISWELQSFLWLLGCVFPESSPISKVLRSIFQVLGNIVLLLRSLYVEKVSVVFVHNL